MRIPINLASEPFRRDRPLLVASGLCAALLVGLLVLQIYLIRATRDDARDARVGVSQLSDQLLAVSNEQAQVEQTLRQPANAQVFQRSLLLNSLVERKAISWTRIFADLERVKPYNVRVIQIRLPKINSHQEVSLDMTVGMEDYLPSVDFMNKLAESPLFGPVVIRSMEPPSQSQKLYQYHWSVDYGQRL